MYNPNLPEGPKAAQLPNHSPEGASGQHVRFPLEDVTDSGWRQLKVSKCKQSRWTEPRTDWLKPAYFVLIFQESRGLPSFSRSVFPLIERENENDPQISDLAPRQEDSVRQKEENVKVNVLFPTA